jgi:hypothetical protein
MLEEFGLPRNGKHYRRLIEGFKRVFTSTIYSGTDDRFSDRAIWEFTRFAFFDHLPLWYMKKHLAGEAATSDNIITLSEQFWDEIRQHPIPADLNVVRALVNSPGCFDLYLWLVWRCFKLKRDAQERRRHRTGPPETGRRRSESLLQLTAIRPPRLCRSAVCPQINSY